MNYETIILDKNDGVATIYINRPDKYNVASPEVLSELDAALTEIEQDSNMRVVVLTGKGDAFSAGADIGRWDPKIINAINYTETIARTFTHFEYCPKPIIAAVNGIAYGFGTGITLACDIVIASDKAKFGLKEINHGIMPTDVILRGVEYMGKHAIAYMSLTGFTISPAEALTMGLVNKVVPHEELMTAVGKICDVLKQGAPLAQRLVKKLMNRNARADWDWAVATSPVLFFSEDVAEAQAAFAEKRKPQFKGR